MYHAIVRIWMEKIHILHSSPNLDGPPTHGPGWPRPSRARHELHPLQIQNLHLSKVRAQRCKASTLQLGVLGERWDFTMGKMGKMAKNWEKNMEKSWDMNQSCWEKWQMPGVCQLDHSSSPESSHFRWTPLDVLTQVRVISTN